MSADGLNGIAEFNMSHTSEVHVLIVRAQSPDIAMVEATFDTGTTIRTTATNGLFVLAAEQAFNVCEMRSIDHEGTVIRRTHLWGNIVDELDRTGAPVCEADE